MLAYCPMKYKIASLDTYCTQRKHKCAKNLLPRMLHDDTPVAGLAPFQPPQRNTLLPKHFYVS